MALDIKEVNKSNLNQQYKNVINSLDNLLTVTDYPDNESVKRTNNYLNWVKLKTDIIINEDAIIIPLVTLPSKIDNYKFNKLKQQDKNLVSQYYELSNNEYLLKNNITISNETILELAKILVLRRKTVVWVDFGFNIGEEFGGKHPALILKSISNELIVVPLSSQEPDEIRDFHVRVDKVYKFVSKIRWINIYRIKPISILRVDFTSPIGDVKGVVLDKISEAIQNCGIR